MQILRKTIHSEINKNIIFNFYILNLKINLNLNQQQKTKKF